MEGQFINDTKKIQSALTFNRVSYSVSNGNDKGCDHFLFNTLKIVH